MTALKAHEVARFLQRPDTEAGVFLVYGPDAGLVRETAQRLTALLAGSGGEVVTLDGAELDADPGRLAVEAKTLSLFGEKRVLRLRGPGKAVAPVLSELLAHPADTAVVVEAGNLAPKDSLRALVEKSAAGRALPCYPDSERSLQELIAESFGKAGIVLEADAAASLRDLLGNDREVTRRELEKLQLFAAASGRISRSDVLALCADNAALVLDEVMDATGTGHAQRLEAAIDRALAAAVNPQQLLAYALTHFAALRRWRIEVDAGASPRDVLERQRPKPHFSRRPALEQQLRLWNDSALAAALERLHLATAESRRLYALQETLVRRALLAICTMAAER